MTKTKLSNGSILYFIFGKENQKSASTKIPPPFVSIAESAFLWSCLYLHLILVVADGDILNRLLACMPRALAFALLIFVLLSRYGDCFFFVLFTAFVRLNYLYMCFCRSARK